MKKMKTTIAATVALAACVSAGLFAAGTDATIPPNHHKTNDQGAHGTLATGWYGPGYDGGTGYFNPARSDEYNPYPFYNIVGGESFDFLYEYHLPDQNESPLNPQAALTRHGVTAPRLKNVTDRMSSLSLKGKTARVVPTRSTQNLPPAAN
jgi:opacity protein-like surface antigen